LRKELGCELQVGATDQWGNITAGVELTRRKLAATVWGLTFPLLTKSDGTKYGKSASGAVYLDPRRTSPYRFYQFFVQAEDADVIKLLNTLTFVPRDEVLALGQEVIASPGARSAQKRLARELTTLVHGPTACDDAVRASEILFGGSLEGISQAAFGEIAGEVPTRELGRDRLAGAGVSLLELLVDSGLCASKGQARKDVEGGGIYLNNLREGRVQRMVTPADLLFDQQLLLRKGKRNYVLLTVR